MSTEIRQLTKDGEVFYPLTHIDALVGNNGSGIDDEPVDSSKNLVRSGGVYKALKKMRVATDIILGVEVSDSVSSESIWGTDIDISLIENGTTLYIYCDSGNDLYYNKLHNITHKLTGWTSIEKTDEMQNLQLLCFYRENEVYTATLVVTTNPAKYYFTKTGEYLDQIQDIIKDNELYEVKEEVSATINWENLLFNKYDVFQREVVAIKARFHSAINTEIFIFDIFTKTKIKIGEVPDDVIIPNDYTYYRLPNPIYVRANQYVGFSSNIMWGNPGKNKIRGCWIYGDNGWEDQRGVIFDYSLIVKKSADNFINKTFSVIGDSISTDYYTKDEDGTVDSSKQYYNRLADSCNMNLYACSAYGSTAIMQGLFQANKYPETHSFSLPDRWGNLFSNGAEGEIPNYIFVEGGINDWGACDIDNTFKKLATLGSLDDGHDDPTKSFYAAFSYLIYNLQQKYKGSQIIVLSPMRVFDSSRISEKFPITNKYSNLTIEQFVKAEEDVCRTYGARFINLYELFPSHEGFSSGKIMYDTYHPNRAGFAIIEELILNFIKNII